MKKVIFIVLSILICSLGGLVGLLMGVALWKGAIISFVGCLILTVADILTEYFKIKIDDYRKANTKEV